MNKSMKFSDDWMTAAMPTLSESQITRPADVIRGQITKTTDARMHIFWL